MNIDAVSVFYLDRCRNEGVGLHIFKLYFVMYSVKLNDLDLLLTLFSPSDVTAFHRMKYGGGVLYNLVFTK